MWARGSSSMAAVGLLVIGVSATSARRVGAVGRTCLPSCCRGRSPGVTPASSAERRVERREGPKAPRHDQFVARGIAEALQAVGAGASYMRVSRVARDRARRFRFDVETGCASPLTGSLSLIGWRCSAPVVFERHRPVAWPVEGSLLLDPCRSGSGRWTGAGSRSRAAGFALAVFCAVGYRAGTPRLWAAEAFSSAHPANWSAFLGSLPGEPRRIVWRRSQGDVAGTIEERWPQTVRGASAARAEAPAEKGAKEQPERRAQRAASPRCLGAGGAILLAPVRAGGMDCREREPRSLDRGQRPGDRGTVCSPGAGVSPSCGHAADHSRPGADHATNHRGTSPPSLRAEEPRAAQPAVAAAAATRRRPRRRPGLRQSHPPPARGKRRPTLANPTRDRPPRRLTLPPLT
jgi:hypothetical protein